MKIAMTSFREGEPRFLRGTVNFGDKGLQHRRAGRHLSYGDACAVFLGDCRHARAYAFGDVMALRFPVVLGDKIDLQVGHVRSAPHEIVADESVEIKGRRRSRVDLVVRDLRLLAHSGCDFACGLRGAFERTAFRHVQDDLEFAFVVEGQHLHLHPADGHRAHRREEKSANGSEEDSACSPAAYERSHNAAIQPREKVLLVLDTRMRSAAARSGSVCEKPPFTVAPAEHTDRGPGGDDEGDGQREEHRGTRANGNGTHVWSHQATDKGHRQNRRR